MRGREGRRLRIGDYRVIYEVDDDLVVALRYAYSDRPPSHKQCARMVQELLHQALASLDGGSASVAFTGFREDGLKRLRTDEFHLSPPPP